VTGVGKDSPWVVFAPYTGL